MLKKTDYKQLLDQYKQYSAFIAKATIDTLIKETDDEQQARVKRLLRPELYADFFDYYLGRNTPVPLADSDCAWFHKMSYADIYANPFLTQYRLWFRGAAKSIHANVGNPLALKQAGLIKFFLVVGVNEKRAKMLLSDLQVQFEANQRIVKDFGKQVCYGSWADGAFETTDGSFFMALGIEQPFRGLRKYANRLDFVSIDDVEDRKVAKNETIVNERTEKILSDLIPAFGKHSQRLVVSNNLIEKKGIVATLMAKRNNPNPKYTQTIQVDIADDENLPMWPERYSKTDIVRLKKTTDPYTWKREYMNTPVDEGRLFKPEWIRFKNVDNYSIYKSIVGHWDLSYTTEGDYKAFALVGNTGAEIHVINLFCRKCEISEALDYHFGIAKHIAKQGAAAMFFFDATAAQQPVFTPLFHQKAIEHNCYAIPFPAYASVDKHLRIEATLTSVFFNKRLFFDEKLKQHPDFEDAKTQILAFDKGSKAHDDFPDTLEAAVRLSQEYTGYEMSSAFEPVFAKRTIKGY